LVGRIELLSPKQIDKLASQNGLAKCPCPAVSSSLCMAQRIDDLSEVSTDFTTRSWRPEEASWDFAEDVDGSRPNIHQATLSYARGFLARPHSGVRRPGPVCPYMPKSLQLDSIKFAVVRTADVPRGELRRTLGRLLLDFLPEFEAMEPSKGRQRQYKTVVFVFPDVALVDARDVIDGAQADTKPQFVSRGLMVGEFHAANNAASLRNPDFFPLRTPHPCLAIRHMVPGDFVFMTLEDYSADLQRKFLSAFLDVFGDEDRKETRDARTKLHQLK